MKPGCVGEAQIVEFRTFNAAAAYPVAPARRRQPS